MAFDAQAYLAANPDLMWAWTQGGDAYIDPNDRRLGLEGWAAKHYNLYGQQEGRPTGSGEVAQSPAQTPTASTGLLGGQTVTAQQITPYKWGEFGLESGMELTPEQVDKLLAGNLLKGSHGFSSYGSATDAAKAYDLMNSDQAEWNKIYGSDPANAGLNQEGIRKPGSMNVALQANGDDAAFAQLYRDPAGKWRIGELGGHTDVNDMLQNRVYNSGGDLLGDIDNAITKVAPFVPLMVAGAGMSGLLDPYTVGAPGAGEAAMMDAAMGAGGFNTAAPGGVFNVAGTGLTAGEIAAMDAAMGAGGYNTAAAGGIFGPSVAGVVGVGGAATTGAGIGTAVIPGTKIPIASALPIAGAVIGAATKPKTAGEEVGGYNNTPIDQNIVNQYGNIPKVTPPKYQGFDSFSMPQGLLDDRLMQIRNNGQRGLL